MKRDHDPHGYDFHETTQPPAPAAAGARPPAGGRTTGLEPAATAVKGDKDERAGKKGEPTRDRSSVRSGSAGGPVAAPTSGRDPDSPVDPIRR